MKPYHLLNRLLLLTLLLAACTPTAAPTQPAAPVTLTVMTHDSFAVTAGLVQKFEAENNVKISFVKSGDTGAALNRAILSKDTPLADVFYGVDNSFLQRALEAGIFEPYASPLLKQIPQQYQLDPEARALPVDYGDVCLNYDRAYFAEKKLAVPASLEDLTQPQYRGLLAVMNPATSSPGLAFLLATVAHFGPDGYLNYWKELRANGLVVVNDWETGYYTNFSASSGKGPQPIVLSYATSPVAEVVFASTPPSEPPTAALTTPDMCFRQIEFVGILKGTQQRALAEKFVDWMLSTDFQQDVPLQMFVLPVNPQAKLPEPFQKHMQAAGSPAQLDPQQISANRDAWIQAWDEAVLR